MSRVKRWSIALGIVVTFGLVAGHDVAPETVSVVPVVDDTRSTRVHEDDADQLDDHTEASKTSTRIAAGFGETWAEMRAAYKQAKRDVEQRDNGDVSLSSDPAVVPGVCRIYEGSVTVYSCVPLHSPGGGTAMKAEEDSSARYTDGYVIDGEDKTFSR